MSLEAFMIELKEDNVKYVASKKFKDGEGNPVQWELRKITAKENQDIRKDCYIKVQMTGKRGMYSKDFDSTKYLSKLVEECVVYPDLKSQTLQDFYKVYTAEDLIGKLLSPGEYDDLTTKIQEINGYNLDEEVQEIKN